MAAAVKFVEALQVAYPDLTEWFVQMGELHQRKLWHELTLKLEQFLDSRVAKDGELLKELYHNFIVDFETRINPLKLAHFAVIVSNQYKEREVAVHFLEQVVEKLRATKERRIEEPILYVKMQIASLKLQGGDEKACKQLIEEGKSTLDSMTDLDPTVHAAVHWVATQHNKLREDYAAFYRSALMYLAYTSVEKSTEEFKLELAINVLEGTRFEWLYHLLLAFNTGDLSKYDELCNVYAADLNAQPELVQNVKRLREKITILCLMELIFSRPSEDRTIPLATIAEKTKLPLDGVEYLLMKTLSVHLIEGVIDQVEGTVRVSWVQPRVLGIPQIKALRDRLDAWLAKVHSTLIAVESEMPDLLTV
ncbi:hypothetical protein CBR_g12752 [Chara braunii]|uniref:PCI domain-containing protein n=1 Tax=Chara braunii TaxID=69332 RepID=A0A388KSX0_CHABU|nr:hypothetical protein CBR_g12752 [Chara braunii]|eukprot:GBG73033.1 hypothetical protein CBR_g12752 [Chara braunii]